MKELKLKSSQCSHCGVRMHIYKVPIKDLEIIGKVSA